jgi:protocatechuate 3,4-dioxygenase beta subunit
MLWIALPVLLLQTTQIAPRTPRDPALPSQITPRDSAQPRQGTASIRGRVTAADTGLPLRRAFVSLMGGAETRGPSGPRTVATDPEGRFAFTRLPAGTYHVRVTPGPYRAQYLALPFGGRRSMDAGQPIDLKDGQRFDAADVALPRGAAITGRVVDEFGEPIARVSVYPSRVMPGGGKPQRIGGGFHQTDDLGRFRLYGLEPGEYIVTAEARAWGGGPQPEGASEGFATTHFPSALDEGEAGRVRVTGADAGDLDIVLVRTRTFRITGTILDSRGRQVSSMNAQLIRASGSGSSGGMSTDATGRFTIRDVVPGDYRFIVRPVNFGPNQPSPPPESREYANVPLTVTSDIDDLLIATQPGVLVSGRLVFAEGTPAKPPSGLRVMAQPGERTVSMGPSATATVGPDLQFTLADLYDRQFVRLMGLPPGHALKAVMLGATDITDTAVEFKPEHSKHLEIVVTSRTSTLEGTVTDESGEPASNVTILMIPEDKASWRMGSPRLRMMGNVKNGRFTMPAVLPGRYHLVAVPRERAYIPSEAGVEFFEPLTKEATTIVVGEDEKRTIELRVPRDAQER